MTTTDLDVFMENLKQLLYDDGNKLISSNRLIQAKKPEIKLLYKELDYLIGSGGLDNMNTEDMEKLKPRLINVANKAENVIDMFISSAILKEVDDVQNWKRLHRIVGINFISSTFLKVIDIFTGKGNSNCSLNLKNVMEDLKSIREETRQKIRKSQSQSASPPRVAEAWSGKTTTRMNPSAAEDEQDEGALSLSYDHLPRHLKNCFLYVGGFPENCEIQVQRLIRLWIAEGFIKEAAQRSLEEQAEDYLTDLVDRNLLIVINRRSDGGIKSCRVHHLLRELCLIKAAEEKMYYKLGMPDRSGREKQNRLFADYKLLCEIYSHGSIAPTRSVLCFPSIRALDYVSSRWVPSFLLLRVLDLLNIRISDFSDIPILIHLRYLAVWSGDREFSFSEASLWRLQTLIIKGKYPDSLYSPRNMANMTNLRHLWNERVIALVSRESFPVLFNLHTISRLGLRDGDQTLLQSFPNIKKLGCSVSHTIYNFALLSHLESFKAEPFLSSPNLRVHPFVLPQTLKKLTLTGLRMPWVWMSTIQQLPKLEVLKLLDSSFEGSVWDSTGCDQFRQLKFLKLQGLNVVLWEVSTFNFPQLRKLVVGTCNNLSGIPLEIGNISTLEHIQIANPTFALIKSLDRIQDEQRAKGNYDIHVQFVGSRPHEDEQVFFMGDRYYP